VGWCTDRMRERKVGGVWKVWVLLTLQSDLTERLCSSLVRCLDVPTQKHFKSRCTLSSEPLSETGLLHALLFVLISQEMVTARRRSPFQVSWLGERMFFGWKDAVGKSLPTRHMHPIGADSFFKQCNSFTFSARGDKLILTKSGIVNLL
jgi:hypothetical protein